MKQRAILDLEEEGWKMNVLMLQLEKYHNECCKCYIYFYMFKTDFFDATFCLHTIDRSYCPKETG